LQSYLWCPAKCSWILTDKGGSREKKLFLGFGCAIVLVIPASVGVSNLIEKTYNSSIQSTIDLALETTEEIEEDAELSAAKEEEKKGNLFSELLSKVSDTVTVATDKIENVLNHYLEALAVLLVTSCVIPVLVLFFFVWLVKIILGVDIPTPKRDQWEGLRHP
jgi:predicted PurR-regulated permease PerM